MSDTPIRPVGQLFGRVYLDRGSPTADSDIFRRRLAAYLQYHVEGQKHFHLTKYLKVETGLSVPMWLGAGTNGYKFEEFLLGLQITPMLNVITSIWRFLSTAGGTKLENGQVVFLPGLAWSWRAFVDRALREENLSYEIDERGGMHYLVDEAFAYTRASTLRALEGQRYGAVREAFDDAYRHLDQTTPDAKAAVRSLFESLEILARLMVDTKNLNRWIVQNKLKPLALAPYVGDPAATGAISGAFDALADFVDGLHNYRHGHGTTEPLAPSLDFTIFCLSSGAAYLRWLLLIDKSQSPDLAA